jgi:hypothetical protein
MAKKATLAKMEGFKKQLAEEPKSPQNTKPKKALKTPVKKQEIVIAPAPIPDEPENREGHLPRGQRANFLKTTITIPAEMLTELRALGMRRRSAKQKDTDTSALIREALTDFLKKHRV